MGTDRPASINDVQLLIAADNYRQHAMWLSEKSTLTIKQWHAACENVFIQVVLLILFGVPAVVGYYIKSSDLMYLAIGSMVGFFVSLCLAVGAMNKLERDVAAIQNLNLFAAAQNSFESAIDIKDSVLRKSVS